MLLNLHCHLPGSVRPATLAELAPSLGIPDPSGGWAAALRLAAPGDLTAFLAAVAHTAPFLARADLVERLAYEAGIDAAGDGLDYLELRMGPGRLAGDEQAFDAVVAAACRGLAAATGETGLAAGLVVAALRGLGEDAATAAARVAVRHAGNGVVGFDLAGDESQHADLRPYIAAFAHARASGLGITCHAAEAGPASAALDAVRLLGATRIGHGVHVAQSTEAMAWLADRGIVIEVCPTSNLYTGAVATLGEHPARTFVEHGIAVVLGDDDPTQTGSRLPAERMLLHDTLGFDAERLRRLDEDSVEAAFAEDGVRRSLRRRLGQGIAQEGSADGCTVERIRRT